MILEVEARAIHAPEAEALSHDCHDHQDPLEVLELDTVSQNLEADPGLRVSDLAVRVILIITRK